MVVASGSTGTHGGLVAGFNALSVDLPVLGIGVSRDAAAQEPLVLAEAQPVTDLLGLERTVPVESVRSLGGYWQPGYSRPNPGMVAAVQLMARSEDILLDPVYSGKAMARLIDQVRQGVFRRGENLLFLHTGSVHSLHAQEAAFQ